MSIASNPIQDGPSPPQACAASLNVGNSSGTGAGRRWQLVREPADAAVSEPATVNDAVAVAIGLPSWPR